MPSGEDCWRCLEAIVPWLPVVLGMSANSPWFAGELNGMASNRAPDPRRAAARRSAARVRVVRANGRRGSSGSRSSGSPRTTRASGGTSARIRSSGTLEVRVPDQPTDVHLSAAFAALLQALCATALAGGLPGNEPAARRPRAGRLQPEPLVGGAVRAPRAARASERLELRAGRRARRRAARARPAGGARSSAAPSCSRASTREPARPTCSSQPDSAQAAAADLVTRSLG